MRSWNDDHFTKKARQEDYKARSVYKLAEIERKERLFSGVRTVLDLGAAPGSWTQLCLEKLPTARVFAVDLSPLKIQDQRLKFHHGSFDGLDFSEFLEGGKVDLVLSDMAPKTSGIHDRDVALSFELAEGALNVARKTLTPGGAFVAKIFMGDTFEDYQKLMKNAFLTVKIVRPESVRKQSREIFFVGKGFKDSL